MPRAKSGLADEPNKTTAVQGKKLKETANAPTFAGKDPMSFKSPNGGTPTMLLVTAQGSRYLITSDGMVLRNKSAHASTGGEDQGLKDWSDVIEYYDPSEKPGGAPFALSVSKAIEKRLPIALSNTKDGKRALMIYANGGWKVAKVSDIYNNVATTDDPIVATYSTAPKLNWNVLDYDVGPNKIITRAHPGSPVTHGIKLTQSTNIQEASPAKTITKQIDEVAKVKLSHASDDFGAYVNDGTGKLEPTTMIPVSKIAIFEPDDKFQDPSNAKNLKNIVKAMKAGKELPPILVRRQGLGFQVLDGHHRFMAHRLLGKKEIPARIVSKFNVKDINESQTNKKHGLLKSSVSFNAIYMCEGIHYSKDILLEQMLYENFLSSATQFLGQKANQTIANVKGQINDTINAGIVIKDIVSNPQLLTNTTSQIRKWTSQLVKNITANIQQVGQQLNAPQLTEKLIAAWKFISSKVSEFGSSDGWKGFLGSLGIYGFVKFINEMMQNLTTLKSTIASGVLDSLLGKAKELGTSVLGNITMPGFLGIFDKLTTVKKYFLDVLTQVKDKFGSINVPGTAQFSKGVQLEASGYIPSAKEKNDPRFKTALTVDVKPDAIKKNAKAFNWKTSRAGIPPQANPNGKIAEDLMREWKSFLAEDQQELFPGYDEQHREKRLSNWLAKSWGVQNGKPQTFYHATTKDFDTFNTHGTGFASALGMAYEVERHGSFFAVDPKFAEGFIEDPNTGRVKEGGRVIPVHLSIQSPIDLRDDALSRMLSDPETREEFKANDIDLNSIYNHFYELDRWELFDGPEGAEFVDNLQKLGFDGAIINEAIPNDSNAKSGQVWVAFNPNQVKSVYNRGSFSPDDNRLTKESG
jgi:hypothetical protein